MTIVTGTFKTVDQAQRAVDRISLAGLGRADLSLIMSEHAHAKIVKRVVDPGDASVAAEGVGIGGAIGGTIGALVGGLVAVGALTVPGVGLLVAGPLVALLSGAGAGGATGGIVGGLIGLGVPKTEATKIEKHVATGGIVVTADVDPSDSLRAQGILREERGRQVSATAS